MTESWRNICILINKVFATLKLKVDEIFASYLNKVFATLKLKVDEIFASYLNKVFATLKFFFLFFCVIIPIYCKYLNLLLIVF